MSLTDPPRLLHEGKHLRLLARDYWEYAERTRANTAVVIVALTPEGNVLFCEQFRPPVQKNTIELPAGLVGDEEGAEAEEALVAARRELLEETGYEAARMDIVAEGPISPGLSNEYIYLIRATGLTRAHGGGGVGTEQIRIHEIPLAGVPAFCRRQTAAGLMVDPKVYAGLFFLNADREGALPR